MLVGVMSDTHDKIENIKKAVALFNREKVSLVLHAGDFTSPFSLVPLGDLKADFAGIFGNNDEDLLLFSEWSGQTIHKQPYQFEFGGKRFIVMHEPHLIDALADSGHYDVVIYGHTHKAVVRKKENVLIMNSGETGSPLHGKATVGILDIDHMSAEIISI
jgi:putative phosphoesterase